jgi:hypothetical protein
MSTSSRLNTYDSAELSLVGGTVLECQHCGTAAEETRTFCPSCRRRMRPRDESAATDTAAQGQPPSEAVSEPQPVSAAPPGYATTPWTASGPVPSAATPATIRTLSWILLAALALVIVTDIWQAITEFHRASVVSDLLRDPTSVSLDSVRSADDHVRAAGIAYLLTLLAAGALFITWMYKVVGRVAAHRPQDMRHGKGWAIGGWFVPFLNWVRPKQMFDDAWRGTRPHTSDVPTVPAYVHLWWAAFLISGFLSGVAARLPSDTLHNVRVADRVGAVGDLFNIVAAALAILVVVRLTKRLSDESWERPATTSTVEPYAVR